MGHVRRWGKRERQGRGRQKGGKEAGVEEKRGMTREEKSGEDGREEVRALTGGEGRKSWGYGEGGQERGVWVE